jgi:hypothetical protein
VTEDDLFCPTHIIPGEMQAFLKKMERNLAKGVLHIDEGVKTNQQILHDVQVGLVNPEQMTVTETCRDYNIQDSYCHKNVDEHVIQTSDDELAEPAISEAAYRETPVISIIPGQLESPSRPPDPPKKLKDANGQPLTVLIF